MIALVEAKRDPERTLQAALRAAEVPDSEPIDYARPLRDALWVGALTRAAACPQLDARVLLHSVSALSRRAAGAGDPCGNPGDDL